MCSFYMHYQIKPYFHQSLGTFDWAKPANCNYTPSWRMICLSKLCCCHCSSKFFNILFVTHYLFPLLELQMENHFQNTMFFISFPIGLDFWIILILPLRSWLKDFIMLSFSVIINPDITACLNCVMIAWENLKLVSMGFPIR